MRKGIDHGEHSENHDTYRLQPKKFMQRLMNYIAFHRVRCARRG